MVRVDWKAVAEEYIRGEISMRSLAVKYAIPRSTLRSRAYREGWIGRREAFRGVGAPEDGERRASVGGGLPGTDRTSEGGPATALEEGAAGTDGARAARAEALERSSPAAALEKGAAGTDEARAARAEALERSSPAAALGKTALGKDAAGTDEAGTDSAGRCEKTSPAAALEKTALEKDAAHEEILRVTDRLVRRASELLNSPDEIGVRELGELMRALKNAKEIRMLRPELDEREQLLRLQTLEEKSAGADRTLRIEFSPETEEAAR